MSECIKDKIKNKLHLFLNILAPQKQSIQTFKLLHSSNVLTQNYLQTLKKTTWRAG